MTAVVADVDAVVAAVVVVAAVAERRAQYDTVPHANWVPDATMHPFGS